MKSEFGGYLPDGFALRYFDTLDSTNDELKRLAANGALGGTVVAAGVQHKGRGRHDRTWASEPGNLHLSILTVPDTPISQTLQLNFVAALALVDAVDQMAPDLAGRLSLKWPNDLMLDGKKCAGILLESDGSGWLVVGFGLNVIAAPKIPGRTTAALADVRPVPDAGAFAQALVWAWQAGLTVWQSRGFEPARQRWLSRAMNLGKPITVQLADRVMTGIFEGLDEDGALLLNENGKKTSIMTGEVIVTGG
jgi:BirA family biotin operon repressor/biotin-[acetyl-CoA-carboxylase] ligase